MRAAAWGLAGTLAAPAAAWASDGGPSAAADADSAAVVHRSAPATPRAAAAPARLPEQLDDAGSAGGWPGQAGRLPTPSSYSGRREAAAAQRQAPPADPDFLFGQPRVSVGVRGLLHRARAGSDFYDFANEQLFVPRSADDDPKNPAHGLLNFDAPGIDFDFGYGVASRLDVRFGLAYNESRNASELRNFIGSDGLPIEQSTALSQIEVRAEVAVALTPRGRAIGQYAWIPSRVVPYAGAGIGFVRYDLEQSGEFVDDLGLFEDIYASNDSGMGIHLFGGADIGMTRRLFLNVEIRHVRASATLARDFEGFDPIDLGGLRIGGGVRFVF